jgi:adenosine deaminase
LPCNTCWPTPEYLLLMTETVRPAPRNILLCTLGASWAVIPEIFGWLAPQVLDLYAHHPQRAALDVLRAQHQLKPPDELWICTTEGAQTQASLQLLKDWWHTLGAPLPLRIWTAAGTDQLATQAECNHIRELTLRVVLLATEHAHTDQPHGQGGGGGQLVLSLAGGRKTMSADLQSAGMLFGAQACLHVVGPDPLPGGLFARTDAEKAAQPALFAVPLAPDLARAITPLIAAIGQRNELLDIVLNGRTVNSAAFAVPLAQPGQPCAWPRPVNNERGDTLHAELTRRQRQGSQLLGNFLAQVAQSEHHENWLSLYRLTPAQIAHLRHTQLGAPHANWLTQLPKADLHRHLGGCLDIGAQRLVARAIWSSLDDDVRRSRMQDVREQLSKQEWVWGWPQRLQGPHRSEKAAALLLHASPAQLEHNLYGVTEPRVALKASARGFAAYERPGELSGSALLSHPAAIAPYAQAIVAQARAEGLAYLELRGSPHKYRNHDPAGFLHDLQAALRAAGASVSDTANAADTTGAACAAATAGSATVLPVNTTPFPRIGFIWIIDRRQRSSLAGVVHSAVSARTALGGFLLGLDLAGDEGTHNPADLSSGFAPAFADCMPLTIHAGEGEAPENIWQAAYHLHADRIGHGLTLARHPQLAARFRDRGICLELCPSSNREVVGFFDPDYPASKDLPRYPLREFIDSGLPLTLCTDNPGISRTTLGDEYLAAARMTQGGLSLWECLALMRQGFVHAFLPAACRERMLKGVDARMFALLAGLHHNDIS